MRIRSIHSIMHSTRVFWFPRRIQGWRRQLRALYQDQNGASYSLSVAMILPLWIACLCFAVEITLLLISKQALHTASETALHIGNAWYLHEPEYSDNQNFLEEKMKQAVVRSLVPFCSARAESSENMIGSVSSLLASRQRNDDALSRFDAKYRSLERITRLTITRTQTDTPGLRVQIELDIPLWTPLLARFFQTTVNANGHPARTIETQIWVPVGERDQTLPRIGIAYSPTQVQSWPNDPIH